MDFIVLAGGECDPSLKEATGCQMRAEIEIDGVPLWKRVVQACEPFGNVVLVGGPEKATAKRVEPGKTYLESLKTGLAECHDESVMIVTSDLPDLTENSVKEVLAKSNQFSEFSYPIVPVSRCQAKYPQMKRTTLALREGVFTGGNLAKVNREALIRSLPILERAYRDRKNPLRLAKTVGFGTLGRVLLGRLAPKTLPLRVLENAVGRFLKMKVEGVICEDPATGTDIDSADQLKAYLASKKS
ncbi:MAG: NTP transferase domain-containing protein [Fimbriimonadaceae bacterium]